MTPQNLLNFISQDVRWRIIETLQTAQEGLTPSMLSVQLKLDRDIISTHLVHLRNKKIVVYVPSGHNNLYFLNKEILSTLGREVNKVLQGD